MWGIMTRRFNCSLGKSFVRSTLIQGNGFNLSHVQHLRRSVSEGRGRCLTFDRGLTKTKFRHLLFHGSSDIGGFTRISSLAAMDV